MNSLRARITALLLIAIVTVVGLATFAASRALQPPLPEATMEPVARQIGLLARLAANDPALASGAGVRLQDGPAAGPGSDRLTRMMSHALAATGSSYRVQVSRPEDMPAPVVSVFLGDAGWLVTEMPDPSPPDQGWVILTIWIAMIICGSAIVSLYAAHRLISPLVLLEGAASRIGADGTLPPLPEDGPAEIRATASALNRLSARLRAAMESRMRLVAAAGHDLRTPMTRMRLRAEFIANNEERGKWLADLEELDNIADSAIRLVREEAEQAGREPVRLDLLLREVGCELAELGYPLRLGPTAETRIDAGPMALKRALRNLALNAATHGGGAELA
ncbi:HAMP domain-containing protein, partial [uncultured Paracoccus sp.]|uniref:HAMP domain-containing protein n=1 Tax=uncultured Paracoccus sp. TaxID=189685 RepID=UPI00263560BF